MLKSRLGLVRSALARVIPPTDTITITDIRDTVTTRVVITATLGVIHTTGLPIIVGGRTPTAAIDIASTTGTIDTTKTQINVRLIGWLGAIPSQPIFLPPKIQKVAPRRLRKNSCKIVAHSFCKTPVVISDR